MIGVGQVIRGWDEGVMTMSLGEVQLTCLSDFAYGPDGIDGVIPGRDAHLRSGAPENRLEKKAHYELIHIQSLHCAFASNHFSVSSVLPGCAAGAAAGFGFDALELRFTAPYTPHPHPLKS